MSFTGVLYPGIFYIAFKRLLRGFICWGYSCIPLYIKIDFRGVLLHFRGYLYIFIQYRDNISTVDRSKKMTQKRVLYATHLLYAFFGQN